jgi:hypothetical protein
METRAMDVKLAVQRWEATFRTLDFRTLTVT